jgi:hypothetical protein
MNFSVKKVHIYQDLTFSKSDKCYKNESLTVYKNGVSKKNLEPDREKYLLEEDFRGWANCLPYKGSGIPKSLPVKLAPTESKIEKGTYFFTQGLQPENEENRLAVLAQAAEVLHLESVWQQIELSECVYVRKLKENDKVLFQLFRKII